MAALQLLVTFEFPDDDTADEGTRPIEHARRAWNAKSLGYEVYDTAAAWSQWLELGAPLEPAGTRGELEAPPLVRVAALAAAARAESAHRATLPAGWHDNPVIVERCRSELARARDRASKMTVNGWKGHRRRYARRARAAGEQLPEHVIAWLDGTPSGPGS